MEHRWSSRQPTTGEVVIESARFAKQHAQLRNASVGGVGAEVASSLPVNSRVVLSFAILQNNQLNYYRLPAVVVRRSLNDAGFMFVEHDTAAWRTWREQFEKFNTKLASNARAAVTALPP
jgi:hypothetical protein